MPVMDGLQATRLIRSFEDTGNWNAAVEAGIENPVPFSDSLLNGLDAVSSTRRVPIIAVSTKEFMPIKISPIKNFIISYGR